MDKKLKLISALVVIVLILAFAIFQGTDSLQANLLKIEPKDLITSQLEEGRIIPATAFTIFAPVNGELLKLPVKEGERVEKGDLLALVDTSELQFQLEQIDGQIKALAGEKGQALKNPLPSQIKSQELLIQQGQEDLKLAEIELARVKALYEAGGITEKELNLAENLHASAQFWLEQQKEALISLKSASDSPESKEYYQGRAETLEAQRKLLQSQINKGSITAPINGVVADLNNKEGDLVNSGLSLMEIFEPNQLLVETYLLADSYSEIYPGMPVQLTLARRGEKSEFPGTVTKIAPMAVEKISPLGLNEQRVKIDITPEMPTDFYLLPGTLIDVEFILRKDENALFVPLATLFPYETGDALWTVVGGKAKIQPVETGFRNNRYSIITAGLEPGDLVISDPQLIGLKEGKKIKRK